MRQSRFAVLMTVTIVGLIVWLRPGASALEPTDSSTAPQEISLAQALALSHTAVEQNLLMAQSTEQKRAVKQEKNPADKTKKPKAEKPEKPSSDRMANYQCLEYCVVVRQSCEGLATVQPDIKIATIGSKENNEWSRKCQDVYNNCLNKCNNEENNVPWRRSRFTERQRSEKKGESARDR